MCDSMLTVKDGPGFYRGFFTLSEFNLIILLVEEVELRQMIIGVCPDLDLLLVLPAPFPSFGADPEEAPLGEIGVHNGMYGEGQVFMLVVDEIAEVLFDLV